MNYKPLSLEEVPMLDNNRDEDIAKDGRTTRQIGKLIRSPSLIRLLLMLSASVNLFFIYLFVWQSQRQVGTCRSDYARLASDKAVITRHDNRTIDDEMWTDQRHNVFTGMIAVSNDFVQEHGLLRASKYPWDTSKHTYLLHGFHSMHCVLVFRDAIITIRDRTESKWTIEHLTHCLHTLREDVECQADDLPLYVGRFNGQEHAKIVRPGLGSTRICRDWDKLRQFAIDNTACWNQSLADGIHTPLIEQYKACPDGSQPWLNA